MMDVAGIQELFRYSQWANDRAFEAASGLTLEEFTRDLGNSYPSVRDTLTHVVWAEWIWLQRGRAPLPSTDSTLQNSLRRRADHSVAGTQSRARAFIESVTGERLHAVLDICEPAGSNLAVRLWRQMYHVVNHSTYHRGQLTTMLRQLGRVPVPTDFLVFHDELDSGTNPRPRS